MHEKNIKRLVVKQLKREMPNWKRLPRKEKRALARQVLEEVARGYSFDKELTVALHELTGAPAIDEEIITLSRMEEMVKEGGAVLRLFPLCRRRYLRDPELLAIDELLDDSIINRLIAPAGYSPAMRDVHPSNLLRAELLKARKYPEFSYRKFCETQLNDLDRKENRAFVRLPLHRKIKIDHSRLSQFRSALSFSRMVNLMVYIIHLFLKSGRFDRNSVVYGVD